jgi:DNA-binding XRE family transcriptional regulator
MPPPQGWECDPHLLYVGECPVRRSNPRSFNASVLLLTYDHDQVQRSWVPADQPQWILDARRQVGLRIRDARVFADLTQEELAHHTGIDRSTIQRIEYGGEIKLSHLLLIARALRVHVTELLD